MTKILFLGTPDFVQPVKSSIQKRFKLVDKIEEADLVVVASYGKILSKKELDTPKYGAINIHPSALPKYRGPSPIQTQILQGVKESAITFIKMDEEVDHGPIIEQIPFEIKEDDTFESAAKRAFELASEHLPEVISKYIKRQIKVSVQDDSKATFTQHLNKQSGFLDLESIPLQEKMDRMIRAYYPWPGVWFKTVLNGKNVKVKLLPEKKIQVEGKNPMDFKDFANGYKEGEAVISALGV